MWCNLNSLTCRDETLVDSVIIGSKIANILHRKMKFVKVGQGVLDRTHTGRKVKGLFEEDCSLGICSFCFLDKETHNDVDHNPLF